MRCRRGAAPRGTERAPTAPRPRDYGRRFSARESSFEILIQPAEHHALPHAAVAPVQDPGTPAGEEKAIAAHSPTLCHWEVRIPLPQHDSGAEPASVTHA